MVLDNVSLLFHSIHRSITSPPGRIKNSLWICLGREEERKEIDPYIQCILCGICFGACPAFIRDSQFLGPAMLAKAYRFFADSRDCRVKEILDGLDGQKGVWGCNTVFQCVKVCPKEVPPTHAIIKMRNRILKYRISSIISRLSSIVSRHS